MLWMHKGKGLKHHRLPHTCCSVFHFPRTSSCFGAEDPYMSPTCLKGKQFSSSQVIFQSFIWNLNLLDCIHTLLHLWKSCRYFKHSPHKGGKRLQNPACVNGLTNMVILGWCMRHLSSEQISMAVIEKKPRNFFDLTDSYQSGSIELQNTDVLTSAFCLCQNYSQSEGTQEKVLSCFYHRVFLHKQREEGSPLPSHPTQQEHGVFALQILLLLLYSRQTMAGQLRHFLCQYKESLPLIYLLCSFPLFCCLSMSNREQAKRSHHFCADGVWFDIKVWSTFWWIHPKSIQCILALLSVTPTEGFL